jgi:predicted nuclease of predicted toxin-antitoxin system
MTIMTSDLDFSAILALSGSTKPSVIQLRSDTTLPVHVGRLVVEAIEEAEQDLLSGAVLTVASGQHRLRVLPLNPAPEG